MRPELINYLDEHPDYRFFIRLNPEWYTRLSRNPYDIKILKEKTDDFYGRSITKKIDKFGEQLDMLNMLMDLALVMEESPVKTGEQK